MSKKYLFSLVVGLLVAFSASSIHAYVPYEIVLEPDPNHSWESQSVSTPFVIYDYDEGVYKLWYSGNFFHSGSVDDGIGYATSVDGVNWQNRRLVDGIGSGYYQISHPWVIKSGSTYRIWHRHYFDWCSGEWSSYINYCESPDGINWGPETYNFGCPGHTWDYYQFDLGSILSKSDTTFLYYSAAWEPAPFWHRAIGRASSTDGGLNWSDRILVLNPDSIVYHDSVANEVLSPNVTVKEDGSFEIFFTASFLPSVGDGWLVMYRGVSQDGRNWTNIEVFLTCEMLGANVTDILTPFYFKDKDGKEYLYFAFTEAKGNTKIARISLEQIPAIPTLTEWGLIIFGVVLLGFITWVFLRRRKVIGVRV